MQKIAAQLRITKRQRDGGLTRGTTRGMRGVGGAGKAWCFRVHVLVSLLRRESSTRGWEGGDCPLVGVGVKGAG